MVSDSSFLGGKKNKLKADGGEGSVERKEFEEKGSPERRIGRGEKIPYGRKENGLQKKKGGGGKQRRKRERIGSIIIEGKRYEGCREKKNRKPIPKEERLQEVSVWLKKSSHSLKV